jgi:hypothetical protein
MQGFNVFHTCVYTVAPLQGEGWGGVVQGVQTSTQSIKLLDPRWT